MTAIFSSRGLFLRGDHPRCDKIKQTSKQAITHMHLHNAVRLVWSSLRPTPITMNMSISDFKLELFAYMVCLQLDVAVT